MKVISLEEIKKVLDNLDVLPLIESGFVAYSHGEAVVPPVGELLLDKGEVHIKYGYIRKQRYYVIKIASGFYGNAELGLPTGNGLMLAFDQENGKPKALLCDEGYLTDIRTAAAGALGVKHLGPPQIHRIGVLGTGVQARLQVRMLSSVTPCREVMVWGRRLEASEKYAEDMEPYGFRVRPVQETEEVAEACNLLVTTTPAKSPLLYARSVKPGTHINAIGSDTPGKQELEAELLSKADLVVADSRLQCIERGEIASAIHAGLLEIENIPEIGEVIVQPGLGRKEADEISIFDSTGVAVQDVQIATAVVDQIL